MTQIKHRVFGVAAVAAILSIVACGGSSPSSTPAPAAAPAPSAPAAPTAPAALTLVEPAEGAFSGHVDSFRWTPVEGAWGYKLKLSAASGRVVWESPVLNGLEAHLPATIALEPEAHVWQVTAMKGTDVLVTSAPGRFTVTP